MVNRSEVTSQGCGFSTRGGWVQWQNATEQAIRLAICQTRNRRDPFPDEV